MFVLDANVLISAFRDDAPHHARARAWLEGMGLTASSFTVPDVCFSALLRVSTNPRAFSRPSRMVDALAFANEVRTRHGFRNSQPGPAQWAMFIGYCRAAGIVGNHVTDAYLAAFTAERNDELITLDRGFSRFPGLRWRFLPDL